jgi:hypothetical protein
MSINLTNNIIRKLPFLNDVLHTNFYVLLFSISVQIFMYYFFLLVYTIKYYVLLFSISVHN